MKINYSKVSRNECDRMIHRRTQYSATVSKWWTGWRIPNIVEKWNNKCECFGTRWERTLLTSHIFTLSQWLHRIEPLQNRDFYKYSNSLNFDIAHLYPEKLKIFHQCPVFVSVSILNPFVFIQDTTDGKFTFEGIDIWMIATVLNFTHVFTLSVTGQEVDKIGNRMIFKSLDMVRFLSRKWLKIINFEAGYMVLGRMVQVSPSWDFGGRLPQMISSGIAIVERRMWEVWRLLFQPR